MRKIFAFLLCICLVFTAFSPTVAVFAQTNDCTITVKTVKGNLGDTVFVPISIDNNPGISAVTIGITYDSSTLIYQGYDKGLAFTDGLMLKEHPDKNIIKIALVEASKDSTNNDDILTLKFKIADNAEAGLSKIDIEYRKGDFANWKLESIMPKIVSGGVEVAYNPQVQNCSHKTFTKWVAVSKPNCTDPGTEQRECTVCGYKQTRLIDPVGHVFEDVWTVDVPAAKDREGVMSRHCKHCTATTDRITFTLKDAEKGKVENSYGAENPKNSFIKKQFKDQHPGEKFTPTKPGYDGPSYTSSNESGGASADDKDQKSGIGSAGILSKIKESSTGKVILEKITEAVPEFEDILEWIIFAIIMVMYTII